MWRRTVFTFSLVIIHTSAQLDSNGTETAVSECCPCPPPDSGLAQVRGPVDPGVLAPAGCGSLPGLDHCPCLPRDADSEGSASIFIPNTVRFGNAMRSKTKEDAKPLLHPEVDLASSMLETLREVTEEEYRDAIERDVARAATPDMDTVIVTDTYPVETRNVVTIIVSPEDMSSADDSMSQASHVHDTRCIHGPLGNARLSNYHQPQVSHKGLDDILNLPLPGGLIHKQRDNNLAASNVNESVVKVNNRLDKFLSGFKLRRPDFLNVRPVINAKNSNDNNNFNNGQNSDNMSSNRRLSGKSNNADAPAKESLNNKDALEISENNLDSDPFPSNTQGKFVEATEGEENNSEIAAIGPKFITQNYFNNLQNIRDVEVIPLDVPNIIPTSKLSIPNLNLRTFLNKARESDLDPIKLPKLFDWLSKPSKMSHKNNKDNSGRSTNVEENKESAFVQIIPRNKNVTTDILDALPSPSESINIVSSKDNCLTKQLQKAYRDIKESKELLNSTSAESFDSDFEIVSNSKAENKNDINIVVLDDSNDAKDSISNVEPEFISPEYIEILNDNIQNLGLDEERNNRIISSQKEISDFPSSTKINRTKERNDKVLLEGHPQKILDIIRKRVIEKLDSVLLENARDYISQNVKEKFPEKNDTDDEAISLVGQVSSSKEDSVTESTSFTSVITDELPCVSASTEEVSYKDLQNMSNSLLQESEKNAALKEDRSQTDHNLKSGKKLKEENSDSIELRESEIDKVINEAGKLTNICKKVIEENSITSIFKKTSNTKSNEMIVPNTKDKATYDHDLEPLASEPVINIKLRPNSKSLMNHLSDFESRLRQNIIVQPTPAALTLPDISDFNTNIPTLEEIRNGVSEILGGLARHTSGEDVSYELDSDDFASNINPVLSTGSLTSDSTLSPKPPLKDIDLNIIQLKPLPLIPRLDPLRIEVPGLNLNTYRAKFAIPNSMDIEPLNLASTLSNGGGLFGATLSIQPEKYSNVGNIESTLNTPEPIVLSKVADIISNVKNNARHTLIIPKAIKTPHLTASNNIKDIYGNLKHYTENTVKHIHQNLNYPSFNDIHTNIKANSDNLLSSSRNNIETLQNRAPISNVVDNLKSQTENTMRHLQQTLDSPMISEFSTNVLRNKINLKPSFTTGNKLLSNNFNVPTISNFADDLRSQADSALRNMLETSTPNLPEILISKDKKKQKRLKAKLRQNQIKELQSLTDPKEVLQIISNHQEDFQDKLFAIHTDISDRLESMHNDAINPERLKTILSPANNRYFESFYIPLPSRRTSMSNAKKPVRPVLKTKQPSLGAQKKEFRKSTVSQTSKPKSGISKLSTMRASTGKERNSPKLSKLESAGTAPTIARIDRPAPPKIYSKPKLSKPLDSQLLKNPFFPGLQSAKKLLLPKDNHLTGFGQTTIRPNSAAPITTTKKIVPSGRPKVSNNNRFTPKPFVRQQMPWSAWDGPKTTKLDDSRTSPSTAIPKLQAPLKSNSVTPALLLKNVGSLSSRIQPQSLLKTQPKLKNQPMPQGRVSYPDMKLLDKKINSSLLSKLTEALKSRQSKANLNSSPGESSPRLAMAPAASERVDKVVAPDEPMKENVSYKCKMMCVRTD